MSEIPGSREKIEHLLFAGKELTASHRRTDCGLPVEDKNGRSSLCRSNSRLKSGGTGSCDDDFEASRIFQFSFRLRRRKVRLDHLWIWMFKHSSGLDLVNAKAHHI